MRCSANILSRLVLSVLLAFVVPGQLIEAGELEVSVATDQPSYWPNEVITVSVTAYNPNDYEVTLDFPSSLQASYIMDNVYDWSSDKGFYLALTEVTIGAGSSYTWDLDHSWEEYDLSIGTHSVIGALQPFFGFPDWEYTYYSQPVEFEVAPLPGDFDGDGDVDGADFGIWQSEYPISSGPPYASDADGDGDVDGVDFGIWQANYPTNLGGSAMAITPEPATLALMVIGALALLSRRRFRA